MYNVPRIYDVVTEGGNVPKCKGEARSVYAVLGEVPANLQFEFITSCF